MAANPLQQSPKDKAQADAGHRTPPAGANQTNMHGGMVAPRRYAEGTAMVRSVPNPDTLGEENRQANFALDSGQQMARNVRLFNDDATRINGGAHYAEGTAFVPFAQGDGNLATKQLPTPINTTYGPQMWPPNLPPPPPPAVGGYGVAGSGAALPVVAPAAPTVSVPLTPDHARGMINAAINPSPLPHDAVDPAGLSTADISYANNLRPASRDGSVTRPFVTQIGGEYSPRDPGYGGQTVFAPGGAGHAIANPHAYTPQDFHQATHGYNVDQLMQLYRAVHATPQEQSYQQLQSATLDAAARHAAEQTAAAQARNPKAAATAPQSTSDYADYLRYLRIHAGVGMPTVDIAPGQGQ